MNIGIFDGYDYFGSNYLHRRSNVLEFILKNIYFTFPFIISFGIKNE